MVAEGHLGSRSWWVNASHRCCGRSGSAVGHDWRTFGCFSWGGVAESDALCVAGVGAEVVRDAAIVERQEPALPMVLGRLGAVLVMTALGVVYCCCVALGYGWGGGTDAAACCGLCVGRFVRCDGHASIRWVALVVPCPRLDACWRDVEHVASGAGCGGGHLVWRQR